MKSFDQDLAWLEYRDVLENGGGNCPCCQRWGKINGYQITSTQVRGMIWMFQNFFEDEWVDLGKAPKWVLRSKSMATLHHWGLLETKKNADKKVRGSGLWRLTPLGRDFIHRHITLPKYAFVFNNRLEKYSEEQVDVVQALGKKFSYEELMNTTYEATK
jgi:hypothetical protein